MSDVKLVPAALIESGNGHWTQSQVGAVPVGETVFVADRQMYATVVVNTDEQAGPYDRSLVFHDEGSVPSSEVPWGWWVNPHYLVYTAEPYQYPYATVAEVRHPSMPHPVLMVTAVRNGALVWVSLDDYYDPKAFYTMDEVRVRCVLYMLD